MKALKLLIFFLFFACYSFAQVIYPKGTATGTDTYTVTISPTFTAYYEDQRVLIEFTNANTGAATININSKGAKSIVKSGSIALSAGDISAGLYFLVYDGTNFQMIGDGGGWGGITGTLADQTDLQTALDTKENIISGITLTGANTKTGTASPVPTAYTTNEKYLVYNSTVNMGVVTVNLNGLGAKAVTKNGTTALASGDMAAGAFYLLAYDGTRFQIVGLVGIPTSGQVTLTGDLNLLGGGSNNMAIGTSLSKIQNLQFNAATGITVAAPIILLDAGASGVSVETDGDFIITDTRATKKGIQTAETGYVTDDRSYTDKEYVDDALTLKADLALLDPTASSGTSIAFDLPRTYGYSSDETGNITLNATGLREGVTQLLIHNDSSEPTFGSEFLIISGEYTINVDNYIMFHAVKSDLILVTISQEL